MEFSQNRRPIVDLVMMDNVCIEDQIRRNTTCDSFLWSYTEIMHYREFLTNDDNLPRHANNINWLVRNSGGGNIMISEPSRLGEIPNKAAMIADALTQPDSIKYVEAFDWENQAPLTTASIGLSTHFVLFNTAAPHRHQPITSHVCHCHPLHQSRASATNLVRSLTRCQWIISLALLLFKINVVQAAVLPSQSSNSSASSDSESSFKDWPYILVAAFVALGFFEAGRRFNDVWKFSGLAMASSAIVYLTMVGDHNVSGLVTWTTWIFCALFTALFARQDFLKLRFGQGHMVLVFLTATIIDSFAVSALQSSSATSGGNAFFAALLPCLALSFFACGRLRDVWKSWPLQWRNQALDSETV